MNLLVGVCTILLIVLRDINSVKDPLDKQNVAFNFYNDWLLKRWDNAGLMVISGLIGWALSGELAIPIIEKYLDWPELAEKAIDLTSIVLVTAISSQHLGKLFGLKMTK